MPSGSYADVGSTAPTITDFSNAQHQHNSTIQGGDIPGIVKTFVENEFTSLQTFDADPNHAVAIGPDLLSNNDITDWDQGDPTDWSLVDGYLQHSTGSFGEIGQSVTFDTSAAYKLTAIVSSRSAGNLLIYANWADIGFLGGGLTTNGTYTSSSSSIPRVNDVIYVDASSDWDGTVSLSLVTVGEGGTVQFKNFAGSVVGGMGALGDNLRIAPTTGLQINGSTIILPDLPTSSSGLPTGALWNDAGVLKIA